MKRHLLFGLLMMAIAILACESENSHSGSSPTGEVALVSTPSPSAFDEGITLFGFFPSPPQVTLESMLQHFEDMGRHGDFVLFQPNVPWKDFVESIEGDSPSRSDMRNQVILARQNDLEWVFVIDPLNGLDRREFHGLPLFWSANFGNPDVRAAFRNFSIWVVREFHPRYLGLASEINTYLDAHPEDVEHYMSLYREVYAAVKSESPDTQIFVTFQWDDLNNMFEPASEGRAARDTNWDQVEAFEPELDIWAISSYPYFIFPSGDIPDDYYRPLLERTQKPLAVAEGGWASRAAGPVEGSPEGQVGYLRAIQDQIGGRISFWVYLILNDLDMESYKEIMREEGRGGRDLDTLSMFSSVGLREFDGTPKPALEVWDNYREAR